MADRIELPVSEQTLDPRDPAEKVRGFPKTPGVYLMKDGRAMSSTSARPRTCVAGRGRTS